MSDAGGTRLQPIPLPHEVPKRRSTGPSPATDDLSETLEWGDGGGAEEILEWGPLEAAEAVDFDPEALAAENERRLLIRIEHNDRLGLGNVGWFLQEVDDLILASAGAKAERAEIVSVNSGSFVVVFAAGGIAIATLAWKIFSHFQAQWIEKRRRDEAWSRDDQIRRQQWEREDELKRQEWEREDAKSRDAREGSEKRLANRLDPNITNIIIVTSDGVRLEVNEAPKSEESLAPA